MTDRYPIDGSRDALWMATGVAPPETEFLTGELKVDVAIIGGGFTGLNAALHLAESGTSVAVLEAADLRFGASGRSGGQINLGLNLGPRDLIDLYGPGPGERLAEAIVKTPGDIFDLIQRHQLDCDPVQNGWVQGAVIVRIEARFGFHGWGITDGLEQAAVVEPVDPFERGEIDGFQVRPGALAADHFGLEETDHGFGERLVAAVADTAGRGLDPRFGTFAQRSSYAK